MRAAGLHLAAAVVVDVARSYSATIRIGVRVVVDDEHAAAAQRHEGEARRRSWCAGRSGRCPGAASGPGRARPLGVLQLARSRVGAGLERERLVRVVGARSAEAACRSGWRRSGAAGRASARRRAPGCPRRCSRPASRVSASRKATCPVARKADHRVGVAARAVIVAAVENEHVRTLRRRCRSSPCSRSRDVAGEARSTRARPWRRRRRARAPSKMWSVPAPRLHLVLLVDQPDLVGASAMAVVGCGRCRRVPTTATAAVQTSAPAPTRSEAWLHGTPPG